MKKFISILLIFVMTFSSISYADGNPVITPLRKGQLAPYSGVLFSPEASAKVITELESFPERTKIEVEAAVKTAEAKKDFKISEVQSQCKTDKDVLQASIDSKNAEEIILQNRVKELEDNVPNKPLIFGAGFIGGILFTLATVFAVSYVTK